METEKNTTRLNGDDLAKIFIQYLGQPILIDYLDSDKQELAVLNGIVDHNIYTDKGIGNLTNPKVKYSILLKSLERLLEKDMKDLLTIEWGENGIVEFFHVAEKNTIYIEFVVTDGTRQNKMRYSLKGGLLSWQADFLRARGYALPYGQWSVKQLVELGIYI